MPRKRKPTQQDPQSSGALDPNAALTAALSKRGETWDDEVQRINLSKAEAETLAHHIVRDFEDKRAVSQAWYNNLVEMTKNWRGTPSEKPPPFEGAVDLRMPFTSSFVESFVARLLKAIFGGGRVSSIGSLDGAVNREALAEVNTWFDWENREVVGLYRFMKLLLHNVLVHGLGLALPSYDHREKMLRETRRFQMTQDQLDIQLSTAISQILAEPGPWGVTPDEPPTVEAQSEHGVFKLSDGGKITFAIKGQELCAEVFRQVTTFDGVQVELVRLEDWVSPNNKPDIKDLNFIGVRYFDTVHEFQQKVDNGFYNVKMSKSTLEEIVASADIQEGNTIPREETRLQDAEEGIDSRNSSEYRQTHQEIEFYRWEGYWVWDPSGTPFNIDKALEPAVDIVVHVAVKTNRVCRIARLEDLNKDAERSVIKFSFIEEPGRFVPIGGAEWLKHMQAEMDILHTTRTDAQLLTTAPFGFYEPLAGTRKDVLTIQPGKLQPVKNPQNINFPRLNSNPLVSLQDEQLLWQYGGEQIGLSQQSRGQPTSKRQSASEYVGVSSALDVRTEVILSGIAESLAKLLWRILGLYQKFGSDTRIYRVSGKDGADLMKSFKTDQLSGRMSLRILADLSQSNEQLQRQIKIDLFQLLMNEMLVQLGIVGPDTIWALVKGIADSMHVTDVPLHKPDVPEPSDPPNIEHKQMSLGLPVKGPTMNENFNEHLQAHLRMASDPRCKDFLGEAGFAALGQHIQATAQMQQQVQVMRTILAAQAAATAANNAALGIQPGQEGDQRPGANAGPASPAERQNGGGGGPGPGGGAGGPPATRNGGARPNVPPGVV